MNKPEDEAWEKARKESGFDAAASDLAGRIWRSGYIQGRLDELRWVTQTFERRNEPRVNHRLLSLRIPT